MRAVDGQMYLINMTFVHKIISAFSFKCKCSKTISNEIRLPLKQSRINTKNSYAEKNTHRVGTKMKEHPPQHHLPPHHPTHTHILYIHSAKK